VWDADSGKNFLVNDNTVNNNNIDDNDDDEDDANYNTAVDNDIDDDNYETVVDNDIDDGNDNTTVDDDIILTKLLGRHIDNPNFFYLKEYGMYCYTNPEFDANHNMLDDDSGENNSHEHEHSRAFLDGKLEY